jgi:hypothetical protein
MRVYVEGNSPEYEAMFVAAGHYICAGSEAADLICFTGGADVNPALYGEPCHDRTNFSEFRDGESMDLYEKHRDTPKVGICRGAQLLNVLSGGSMYQHVEGHAIRGTHAVSDLLTGKSVQVSSTHHQMMIPNLGRGVVLADAQLGGHKEGGPVNYNGLHTGYELEGFDAESVMYLGNKCLCFQPHPEFFQPDHECCQLFFSHLNFFLTQLET